MYKLIKRRCLRFEELMMEKLLEVNEYETPVFEKEEELLFPEEIIAEFNEGEDKLCLQCSSCHGCM